MISSGFFRFFRQAALAVCLALITIGCGYTTRAMISTEFKTIHIPPFVNKIDFTRENDVENKYKINKPLLETEITKAVVDKFIFDGNLKLADKQSADLILKGELVEFRRDPFLYPSSTPLFIALFKSPEIFTSCPTSRNTVGSPVSWQIAIFSILAI